MVRKFSIAQVDWLPERMRKILLRRRRDGIGNDRRVASRLWCSSRTAIVVDVGS
jgi:hypothetical protein